MFYIPRCIHGVSGKNCDIFFFHFVFETNKTQIKEKEEEKKKKKIYKK